MRRSIYVIALKSGMDETRETKKRQLKWPLIAHFCFRCFIVERICGGFEALHWLSIDQVYAAFIETTIR